MGIEWPRLEFRRGLFFSNRTSFTCSLLLGGKEAAEVVLIFREESSWDGICRMLRLIVDPV